MSCYRSMLNIRWYDRVTNIEVLARVEPNYRLRQMLMKRKLGLFGHICRMGDHRLIKTITFGMTGGRRKRGRPRRNWIDDIKEWTGMSMQRLIRVASNRQEWKSCVQEVVDTNGHQAHGD